MAAKVLCRSDSGLEDCWMLRQPDEGHGKAAVREEFSERRMLGVWGNTSYSQSLVPHACSSYPTEANRPTT